MEGVGISPEELLVRQVLDAAVGPRLTTIETTVQSLGEAMAYDRSQAQGFRQEVTEQITGIRDQLNAAAAAMQVAMAQQMEQFRMMLAGHAATGASTSTPSTTSSTPA